MIAHCEKVAKRAKLPILHSETLFARTRKTGETGLFGGLDKEIVLDNSLDSLTYAVTFAHELGHCFDPELMNTQEYNRRPAHAEAVAEYVSWIVAEHFGVSVFLEGGNDWFRDRLGRQMQELGSTAEGFQANRALLHRADRALYQILPVEGRQKLAAWRAAQPGFENSGKTLFVRFLDLVLPSKH